MSNYETKLSKRGLVKILIFFQVADVIKLYLGICNLSSFLFSQELKVFLYDEKNT